MILYTNMKTEGNMEITHKDLIGLGSRFLKHQGYWMWLPEPSTECREKPDLIAFKLDGSVVIECKVSRPDFLRDSAKPFRTDGTGMGNYRIYLAPAGLIKPEELLPSWGLLEVLDENTVRFAVRPIYQESGNPEGERMLMYSWAMRSRKGWLPPSVRNKKRFSLILPRGISVVDFHERRLYVCGEYTVEGENKK